MGRATGRSTAASGATGSRVRRVGGVTPTRGTREAGVCPAHDDRHQQPDRSGERQRPPTASSHHCLDAAGMPSRCGALQELLTRVGREQHRRSGDPHTPEAAGAAAGLAPRPSLRQLREELAGRNGHDERDERHDQRQVAVPVRSERLLASSP